MKHLQCHSKNHQRAHKDFNTSMFINVISLFIISTATSFETIWIVIKNI